MRSDYTWPRSLPKGGRIGICSPAGPSPVESLHTAAKNLEDLGYDVVIAKHAQSIHQEYAYLAGTIHERTNDLNTFFCDPGIDLILAARGGYGSAQLLPFLDYDAIRADPKPLVGYSDITSLSLGIFAQTRVVGFSGIMGTAGDGFGQASLEPFSARSFFSAVSPLDQPTQTRFLDSPEGTQLVCMNGRPTPSTLVGRLIPACMTLLVEAIGTPYLPDLKGAILILEDIDEPLYSVDRMFNHLRLSGHLDDVAAVVIGTFNSDTPSVNATLAEYVPSVANQFVPRHIPIITGYPYGHIPCRLTIPTGCTASISLPTGAISIVD